MPFFLRAELWLETKGMTKNMPGLMGKCDYHVGREKKKNTPNTKIVEIVWVTPQGEGTRSRWNVDPNSWRVSRTKAAALRPFSLLKADLFF